MYVTTDTKVIAQDSTATLQEEVEILELAVALGKATLEDYNRLSELRDQD